MANTVKPRKFNVLFVGTSEMKVERLPLDAVVDYYPVFLNEDEALDLYNELIEIYNIDQARIKIHAGGKEIETDSFKILFSSQELIDQQSHPESIHGKSFIWKGAMSRLKNKVEILTRRSFDLAMCLYYPDGNHFAIYHQDQQTRGTDTLLPSLSLGAVREFSFKHVDTGDLHNLHLANGSLLVMGKNCQSRYTHSLLQVDNFNYPRINVTFRDREFC